MSSTLVLVGIVGFVLLAAALCLREARARKRLWARRRLENAKEKGMMLTEYNNWIERISP